MEDDWEGRVRVDEGTFVRVLAESVDVLNREGIPYALLGGVASAALGRPRWTHDIDVFVRGDDARRALKALADAGFKTREKFEHWLYKAVKDHVLVDVIFKSHGDIYYDDDAAAHSLDVEFKGIPVRVLGPEDLLVIKAVNHDEENPRHWHDAIGLIATCDFDWDYLLRRAQFGPRRVLSLLLYAESLDLVVPERVLRELFTSIYPQR